MRKLLTPAFHFSILEQFISIFDSNAEILLSLLKQESRREIVNVFPFVTMCTLDNICGKKIVLSSNEFHFVISKNIIVLFENQFAAIWESETNSLNVQY